MPSIVSLMRVLCVLGETIVCNEASVCNLSRLKKKHSHSALMSRAFHEEKKGKKNQSERFM